MKRFLDSINPMNDHVYYCSSIYFYVVFSYFEVIYYFNNVLK